MFAYNPHASGLKSIAATPLTPNDQSKAKTLAARIHENHATFADHFTTDGQCQPNARQSVTDAESFPTATVHLIVSVARFLWITGRHITPYVVGDSKKANESISVSQNDSSEQSRSAEPENSFELRCMHNI